MIISIRLKNFFSLRDEAVIDFTADSSSRKLREELSENLISFEGDKFLKIIGIFGSNAAGKSNIIKAIAYCRNLILNSHLMNEGDTLDYEPFKFEVGMPSYFYINFVVEGIEYEYSFSLLDGSIVSEHLYYYPKKRKAMIFKRDNTDSYTFKKGILNRPNEIIANTGDKTLFLSRASSLNREIPKKIYRFFRYQMIMGLDAIDLDNINIEEFNKNKTKLLKALNVTDSDIINIDIVDKGAGKWFLQSFHQANPDIPFDFLKEESDGTKRLFALLLTLFLRNGESASLFIDEFDLKLHIKLSEFILEFIQVSDNIQFVFTSHNPCLLNREILRLDQIIFVSKREEGNSEFIPLSDYSGLSKKTNIQQAYLQGRFDGVPYIGSAKNLLSYL